MDADLVLEGGGVKAIALVGAITMLEERGYRFHRVAGTSAGAVVAALVAAGVGSERMAEVVRGLDNRRFGDPDLLGRLGPVGIGLTLALTKGIFRGEYLRTWLGELLAEQGVTTFATLRDEDPQRSRQAGEDYRLVVMVSDISRGRLVRLPWDYALYGRAADDALVADAVRASTAIPYFYKPVSMRDEAGETSWMVDGGMLSNFPVGVFDRVDRTPPRWPTIGIKLSARPDSMLGIRNRIRGPLSMATALISTMTSFYDQIHLDDEAVVDRTIFVDTMKVRSTDFHIDQRTQEALFENGRRAAAAFLDGTRGRPGWDFDEYVRKHRS